MYLESRVEVDSAMPHLGHEVEVAGGAIIA